MDNKGRLAVEILGTALLILVKYWSQNRRYK